MPFSGDIKNDGMILEPNTYSIFIKYSLIHYSALCSLESKVPNSK